MCGSLKKLSMIIVVRLFAKVTQIFGKPLKGFWKSLCKSNIKIYRFMQIRSIVSDRVATKLEENRSENTACYAIFIFTRFTFVNFI